MNSGPYEQWVERRADGWWTCELGGGWITEHGPYRWWISAWLQILTHKKEIEMDLETIRILLDLLNPLHGEIDRQLPNQFTDEHEWDAPTDREYNVNITAKMERDLTQAVMILERRKRDYIPPTAA